MSKKFGGVVSQEGIGGVKCVSRYTTTAPVTTTKVSTTTRQTTKESKDMNMIDDTLQYCLSYEKNDQQIVNGDIAKDTGLNSNTEFTLYTVFFLVFEVILNQNF